jgi:dimethylhistidine N-methyltransferase
VETRSESRTFLEDVLEGLSTSPKQIPSKYLYDERGSHLFDRICELEEYYLTRTELAIMERYAGEMADQIGAGVMLIEYGSGSSLKTPLLLDALLDPVAYVPVDISREHLGRSAARLSRRHPEIDVLPVCADFTAEFGLPVPNRCPTHSAVYFPGSTIGNFTPAGATAILGQIAERCGRGGGLLVGIDLQKSPTVIEAAYNDAEGVTAQFSLNLLQRINRELDAQFVVDQFAHRAVYRPQMGRVDISLVSQCDQAVEIADRRIEFAHGEAIHTEYSHKYTIDGFAKMADSVGLSLRRWWTDADEKFAVLHLAILDEEASAADYRSPRRPVIQIDGT